MKYLLSPFEVSHDQIEMIDTVPYSSIMGNIDLKIYKIKDSLNRAWFVKRTIKEDDNLYNYLNSSAFNPEDVAVVNDLDAQSFSKGEILNIQWGIHEIAIDIEASSKSFLVVSEVYYPKRWKLTINNEPSETFQVNGVLRGVMVDAGKHRIEFKYESNSFNYLRFLSNSIIMLSFFVFGLPFAMRLLKGNT